MSYLFGRKWLFQATDASSEGGFFTDELRCVFSIEKTNKWTPDTVDIKIYNLAPTTRQRLARGNQAVVFQAGYDIPSTIYNGEVRSVVSYRDDVDWCTHFLGGETQTKRRVASVNLSFGAGVSMATVITSLFQSLGVGSGNLDDALKVIPGKQSYKNGYVAHGDAYSAFNSVMRAAGLSWTVSGGQLRVAANGRYIGGGYSELLSADTGVVAVEPIKRTNNTLKRASLKLTSLLRPDLKVFQQVTVDMKDVRGEFVIETLVHKGDTHGDEFVTDIHLTEVK